MTSPEPSSPPAPVSDAMLRAACEAVRVGICLVDATGRFVLVNPAFCAMSGFTAAEFTGQPWTLVAPPDVAARADAFLRAVLADSARIPDRWKLKRKDGTLIDILVSFRPLQHEGAHFAVLSFSDITAAQRDDERIRDLNRDLERRIAERTAVIRRNRNVLLELAASTRATGCARCRRFSAPRRARSASSASATGGSPATLRPSNARCSTCCPTAASTPPSPARG